MIDQTFYRLKLMRIFKKNILGVVCLSVFAPATAFSITVPNCKKNQFSDLAKLTKKISVVETDNRELFSDYAKRKNLKSGEIESLFGATGIVYCGGGQGTAQITGNRLVITTAKHVFFNKNCQPYPSGNCFFSLVNDREEIKRIPIDRDSLRTGDCTKPNDSSSDWAVAELKAPAPKEVNPYKVSAVQIPVKIDTVVTQVSAYSDNFFPERGKPRYVTECKVRDIENYAGAPIQSDCDTGPGASGSAQLIEASPGEFTLAAIHVSSSADAYDRMPYNSDDYFNISVPVDKAFKAALDETIQSTNKRLMVSGRKPVPTN